MRDVNAKLLPGEFETRDVRRNQIHQQRDAYKISAGQYERHMMAKHAGADNNPLFEIARLRLVQPFVRLRHRADPHEDNAEREQNHRQTKG